MKKLLLLILAMSSFSYGEVYYSPANDDLPELTIILDNENIAIKGSTDEFHVAKRIDQHAEVFVYVPKNCKCGLEPGEFSGVPTSELFELFLPDHRILKVKRESLNQSVQSTPAATTD